MEELLNLPGHVPGRARQRPGGCGAEVQAVQLEQFAQFDDRGGMVVDPQIDITVQVAAIAPPFLWPRTVRPIAGPGYLLPGIVPPPEPGAAAPAAVRTNARSGRPWP